jgi:hypothetical protein
MKMNRNYIVKAEDIRPEVIEKWREDIITGIIEDGDMREYLFEIAGSDPFDVGKVDGEGIIEYVEDVVQKAIDKSSTEWEVRIQL